MGSSVVKRGRKPTRTYQELVKIKQQQKQSGMRLFTFARKQLKLTMAQYVTLYGQLRRVNLMSAKKRKGVVSKSVEQSAAVSTGVQVGV